MRLAESEGRLTRWRDVMDEITPADAVELHVYLQMAGQSQRQLHAQIVQTSLLGSAFTSKFPPPDQIQMAMSLDFGEPQEMTPDQMAAHAVRMARNG
ncbi:MAG: hypothetical protein EBR82_23560 [Caulobacteraceae bacterium]|nr:hypothetical protein [Caulobacteraceae bacterium]